MAAIKSLGDKGLISNEDRGHLKDLLLNNDSPQLQEALDKYNSTGDFHAVKELLVKELQNPSAKRNAGDWLSESLVNDIALSFVRAAGARATKLSMNMQADDGLSVCRTRATRRLLRTGLTPRARASRRP
jgi:hypothetical protein